MTPNEFAKAMTFLGLNYNKGFTPEYIKMLYPRFASYSYEQIKEAIHKCIDNEKYINNIAYDLGQYLPSVERKTEKRWNMPMTSKRALELKNVPSRRCLGMGGN